ncbi:MAG: hypothetical protein CSB06_03180 [Bacteroidia bacterium]|nr:MAG: hypothetical protein CSB06_03180 [Bacteroidia bacterium]
MSLFHKSLIIFLLLCLIGGIFFICRLFPLILCLLPVILYLPLLVWASANLCSQFYLSAQCRDKKKEGILLTFDDGPHPEITPTVLKILEKYDQKAIFFCIGKNIEKYPEILRKIKQGGHQIGNHSYTHSHFFALFRTRKVIRELQKTNALIQEITGEENKLFRPPHGVTNPNIGRAVNALKMRVIGWSIRTFDTSSSPPKILKKMKKAQAGDIILLHDTQSNTPSILEQYFFEKNNTQKQKKN